MELGLGIHGEPGVRRTELQPANQVTETLLTEILQHGSFGDEQRVAVMVNNLGATTEMELAIVARHAASFLAGKGLTVERIYAGTFLSSLDMAGISISVLGLNEDRLRWLDAADHGSCVAECSQTASGESSPADCCGGEHSGECRQRRANGSRQKNQASH